jgi:hypothetical protein
MLSLILAEIYDLPPPNHIIENNILGHTKVPPKYDHIPQIAVTHSHPHYLLRLPKTIDILDLPKFLIMVRDPRDILVSAYEKIKGDVLQDLIDTQEQVSFSEFLRLDMNIKKPVADIWQIILFMNSWAPILKTHTDNTMFLQYEDLKKETFEQMKTICNFIEIPNVTDDIIKNAIENSDRSKMRKKLDPNEINADKSVNLKIRNFKDWYNDADKDFVNTIFTQHLKDNFGYDLTDWN